MKNKIFEILFNRRSEFAVWSVILGVPLGYFWWNFGRYNGPAFLDDELGYLVNAIFLSGHKIDGASSYHAGYSLLLAPLFLLFDDTSIIWQGAMLINSILFGVSFYFVNRLIVSWDHEISACKRALVILLVSLYPTWVTMSGYVFTTPAFVALFMGSLISLISALKKDGKGLYLFTIWIGLLYWIHPIALAAAGASTIALGAWLIRKRKSFLIYFSHIVGCVGLIALYKYVLHPALSNAMTPEGYQANSHYPSTSIIIEKMQGIQFWWRIGMDLIGEVSYFLVSTLGVALFGSYHVTQQIIRRDESEKWKAYVGIYFLGALLGVIFMGAINFSLIETHEKRIDEWIHGRYLDSVCMPILTISLLVFIGSDWRKRFSLLSTCLSLVILGACIIYLIYENYPPNEYYSMMTVASFWPQYAFPELQSVGLLMLVGAVGIVLTYTVGRVALALGVPLIFMMSLPSQEKAHWEMLGSFNAMPTALVEIIRANVPPGTDISFDSVSLSDNPSQFHKERLSVYKYYLYDYRYRRVSKKGWSEDSSDLILTYWPSNYVDIGIEVARETRSGLSLMKKKSVPDFDISEDTPAYGVIIKDSGSELIAERATITAGELIKMTQVGKFLKDSLFSENQAGYLFFGPYIELGKGDYKLTLFGDFAEAHSAVLDVVGSSGEGTFFGAKFSGKDCSQGAIDFEFSLPEDVSNLEIRLHVSDKDIVSFNRYVIEKKRF